MALKRKLDDPEEYLLAKQATDKKVAMEWYRKAAEKRHAESQYRLGMLYVRRRQTRNFEEAFRWFNIAAFNGHALAQYELASCLYSGRGIPKNMNRSRIWHIMAAQNGCVEAQYMIFIRRKSLDISFEEALRWLQMAANRGDIVAQYDYACILLNRRIELKEAIYLLRTLAATKSNRQSEAQFKLAKRYERKNKKAALIWYMKSARNGHVGAKRWLLNAYKKGIGCQADRYMYLSLLREQ